MNNNVINKKLFTYQAVVETLVVSGEETVTVDFEADSSFVWLKSTIVAFASGNAPLTDSTTFVPSVDVFVRDTGSGSNLMQAPVNIDSITGRGELPYVLPVGYEVAPKSSLQFTFTNNSGAQAYGKFGIVLHGFKIFRAGR